MSLLILFNSPASGTSLAWTGIGSTEAFGTPALTADVALSLSGIVSGEAFGAAVVSQAGTLALTGIASAEAFGAPTVSSAVSLAQTGVASAEAFGALSQSSTVALSVSGLPSAEAFGSVTISAAGGGTGLSLAGIASAEAFGALTLSTSNIALTLTGIPSGEALGSITTQAAVSRALTGIATAEAFGAPTIGVSPVTFVLTGIPSAEAFGLFATQTAAGVSVTGIPTTEAFGAPTLTRATPATLTLTGIPTAEAFGTLTVTRQSGQLISWTGIPSGEAIGILTLRANRAARVTYYSNGQTLVSMAITPQALNTLLQTLTCQLLAIDPASDPLAYAKVRLDWPGEGQPAWGRDEDICFIRVMEEDSDYNRIRDRAFAPLQQTDTYTRVWRVTWACYGPNSFDNARLLKSGLFSLDTAADTLSNASLYLLTDIPATTRAPEKFQNQWWDRTDLSVHLNELVTETLSIGDITSAEVLLSTERGLAADIKATKA